MYSLFIYYLLHLINAPVYDSVLLDQVDVLRKPWIDTVCPFCTATELEAMSKARARIQEELLALKDIVFAIQNDRCEEGERMGCIGNIVLTKVNNTKLKELMCVEYSKVENLILWSSIIIVL